MRKAQVSRLRTRVVLGAAAALALSTSALVAPATAADDRAPLRGAAQANAIPGEYIVVMEPGAPKQAAGNARRDARSEGGQIRFTFIHTVSGFAAKLPARALEAMRNNPNVEYIEVDSTVSLDATQTPGATWGLDRIDQRDLPLSYTYTYNYTGAGSRRTSSTPASASAIASSVAAPAMATTPSTNVRQPLTATATARTWRARSAAPPTVWPRASPWWPCAC